MAKTYRYKSGSEGVSDENRASSPLAHEFARQQEREAGDREGGWYDEPDRGQGKMGSIGEIVQARTCTTVLTSFGLGFGFGLAVTLLLTRREISWYERYAPDALRHLPDRLRNVPEALTSYLPASWKP